MDASVEAATAAVAVAAPGPAPAAATAAAADDDPPPTAPCPAPGRGAEARAAAAVAAVLAPDRAQSKRGHLETKRTGKPTRIVARDLHSYKSTFRIFIIRPSSYFVFEKKNLNPFYVNPIFS